MKLQLMTADPLQEKRNQGKALDPLGAVLADSRQLRHVLALLVQQKHGGAVEVDVRDLIMMSWDTTIEITDPDHNGVVRIVVR